jgi:uncharacterized phage protein (TIGR02220 family)
MENQESLDGGDLMARPISSVHVDIAEFLSETMDVLMENPGNPDHALAEWTRRFAKALAKRDPSIHAYAGKLLAEAGEFIESKSAAGKAAADEKWRKEREKAAASGSMPSDAGASGFNAGASNSNAGASDGMRNDASEQTDQSSHNRSGKGKNTPVSLFPEIDFQETAKAILDHLNLKTGKAFRNGKATAAHIRARLNDGFTLPDFKSVIDKKAAEWGMDPRWEKFLRPETLFGNKMDGYLNQKMVDRGQDKTAGGFRGGPPQDLEDDLRITGTGA